jgi:MOSC domain-containing protein YiiM
VNGEVRRNTYASNQWRSAHRGFHALTDGVSERFPKPAGPKSLAVALALMGHDDQRRRDAEPISYPSEHYDYWRGESPATEFPWGMFGENFTSEGLLEDAVNVGDQFRIGSVVAMVTQPRVPCFKLAAKVGREDIVKRFLASGRSGFYLKVVQESEVGAGDPIEPLSRDLYVVTVADVARLYRDRSDDLSLLQRAV